MIEETVIIVLKVIIMKSYDILVIGGVAAGTKVAAKARRGDIAASIGVLTEDPDISYAGCGLPYYLGGVIQTRRQLVVRTPEELKRYNGVEVLTRHRVTSIDPDGQTVAVSNLETGGKEAVSYGKLVLATGARPVRPPIPGIDLGGIHVLRSVTDADSVQASLEGKDDGKVVIVGGGFIGIEVAENLTEKGMDVTVVEMLPQILPPFDPEVALHIQNHLKEKGVKVMTASKVEAFEGDGTVEKVVTSGGAVDADLVVLSIGVAPNSALAEDAGIELGLRKAIKIDGSGRTNLPDIYAAGDCSTVDHVITGDEAWVPMGSTSNKQGRVAAITLGGGDDAFPGTLGTTVVKVFDISAGRTGLGIREAKEKGYDPVSVTVPADDRAHYYPGSRRIFVKLIADRGSGRLLGAQVHGRGTIDKPIDAMVVALTMGAKVEDLTKMDFAYAPPFSTAINPLNLAATVLTNKMTGYMDSISAGEMKERLDDPGWDGLVLDIREIPEHMIGAIPDSINIPYVEMIDRLREIEDHKDKEVVVVCNVGRRAFEGYLRLKHHGFEKALVLEAGTKGWPYGLE